MVRFRRLALLAAAIVLPGCSSDRDRPDPSAVSEPAILEVEVTAPRTNDVVIAGSTLAVVVRAREVSGRLHGAGYVIRRSGFEPRVLDSVLIAFGPVVDTVASFDVVIPDSLATNAQLDVFGLAAGPDEETRVSQPKSVVVAQCTPSSAWC